MKKLRICTFITCIMMLFFGCMSTPQGSIPEEDFILGEDIMIGNVDVSRMKISSARILLEQSISLKRADIEITLSCENNQPYVLSGNDIPLTVDIENALREASYLSQYKPIGEDTRAFPLTLKVNESAFMEEASRIADSFSFPAIDATVSYEKDTLFAFTDEKDGQKVSADSILLAVEDGVSTGGKTTHEIDASPIQAQYTKKMAEEEYQLVASYETSYDRDPLNAAGRVYNVEKAASLIDGVFLEPGEEFDMNATLGPRNGDTGWREAPGIVNGKYEQEYGGGVCQVSSTLFNAVLLSDLTITERKPHSWPVSYVDIGRDATISTGGPNLKFVNSSAGTIVISAKTTEDHTLTVDMYGIPLDDGMYITVSSEQTSTLPALGTDIRLDESLPYQTSQVEREERLGKTSTTYKSYYTKDGDLIEKIAIYEDTYRSIEGITYVSTDVFFVGLP